MAANGERYAQISELLIDHPKTTRAMRALRIHRLQLVGHLACLWNWAMKNAPDGDLSRFSYRDIADAARFTDPDDFDEKADADAERFVRALIDCRTTEDGFGFLEADGTDLSIHDWQDYGGRLLDTQRKNAEKVRRHRAGLVSEPVTTTETPSEGASSARNGYVTVTETECNGYSLQSKAKQSKAEHSVAEQQQSRAEQSPPVAPTSPLPSGGDASRFANCPEGDSRALLDALVVAGLSAGAAASLAATKPEECRRQLDFLPYARAKEPGAYLRRAIEGGFSAPAGYEEARKAKEQAAKQSVDRERQKAEQKERSATSEAERARIASLEAQLRADPSTWEVIEALAVSRLPEVVRNKPGSRMYEPSLRSALDTVLTERMGN